MQSTLSPDHRRQYKSTRVLDLLMIVMLAACLIQVVVAIAAGESVPMALIDESDTVTLAGVVMINQRTIRMYITGRR